MTSHFSAHHFCSLLLFTAVSIMICQAAKLGISAAGYAESDMFQE